MSALEPMIMEVTKRGARHGLLKEILEDMLAATKREDICVVDGHLPFKAEPVIHVECSLTDDALLLEDERLYLMLLEPMLNALAGRLEQKGLGPLYLWHGKVSHEYRLDPSYYIAVRTTRKKS